MDVRSDIYSLGATFYQFVTGRFPYEGRTANEIARKHLEATLVAPQLVNLKVPDAIGQIIMKMMKKNVSERYQDAEELVEDLRLFRRGKLSSTNSVPKVFSTRTRGVPRVKKGAADDKSQPIDTGFETTTTGNLKPLYTTATTSSNSKLLFLDEIESTFKKPKKKLIMFSTLMIVCIVFVGAVLMWFYILPMSDKVEPVQTPPIPLPTQRTFRQEFLNAVNKIIADYKSGKIDKKIFLTKSDAVFEDFPRVLPGKEEKTRKKLLEIYVPLDEKVRVVPVRKALRKKHLAEIAARKEKIRQLRIQKERAAKAAEARRIREQKEAEERARKLEIQEREARIRKLKIERRVANYKKSIAKRKDMLTYNFFEFARKRKYADAEKMFREAIREPGKVRKFTKTERNLAKALSVYARHLKKAFDKGKQVNDYFTTSNDKILGLGVEFGRRKYGHIAKIDDGTLYFRMADGSIEKEKLSDFPKYYLYIYYKKVIKRLKVKDEYFYYLLFNGLFNKDIEKYAKDSFWKKELVKIQTEYFKQKLSNSSPEERELLNEKFKKLEAFKKALGK